MAYMVYQRYTTAIRDAYGHGRDPGAIRKQVADARRARAWLESLDIDATLRASLVEPIAIVEDAFDGLLRAARGGRPTASAPGDPEPRAIDI
jgi:hypothetical protein